MKIFEYRGVEGAVYAPIVTDDDTTFEAGTVKSLAGVSEIAKSTDSSNEAHYYDNIPAVVVGSTGSDEITINSSAIPLDVLAEITGQYYDEATGMMVEQERTTKYFAFGYRTKTTDGTEILVWRLKAHSISRIPIMQQKMTEQTQTVRKSLIQVSLQHISSLRQVSQQRQST